MNQTAPTASRAVSPRIRLAFEVADSAAATTALADAGAEVIAPPTRTPWNSLNSRLHTAGDLQITLFEELSEPEVGPQP
jgi:hypothetical protein